MPFDLTVLNKFPLLTTDRLILRAYTIEDASALLKLRTDPLVLNYMDRDPFKNLAESQKFAREKEEERLAHKGVSWVVTRKTNDEFMGDLAFWRLFPKDHRAEIGYSLRSEFWKQGYMSEALTKVLSWGFESLGLHSVLADINPENDASRQLLLKMGFKKEGYHRENYFYKGEYLDSEMYGLIRGDF